jgi:hypothetical protein
MDPKVITFPVYLTFGFVVAFLYASMIECNMILGVYDFLPTTTLFRLTYLVQYCLGAIWHPVTLMESLYQD